MEDKFQFLTYNSDKLMFAIKNLISDKRFNEIELKIIDCFSQGLSFKKTYQELEITSRELTIKIQTLRVKINRELMHNELKLTIRKTPKSFKLPKIK